MTKTVDASLLAAWQQWQCGSAFRVYEERLDLSQAKLDTCTNTLTAASQYADGLHTQVFYLTLAVFSLTLLLIAAVVWIWRLRNTQHIQEKVAVSLCFLAFVSFANLDLDSMRK